MTICAATPLDSARPPEWSPANHVRSSAPPVTHWRFADAVSPAPLSVKGPPLGATLFSGLPLEAVDAHGRYPGASNEDSPAHIESRGLEVVSPSIAATRSSSGCSPLANPAVRCLRIGPRVRLRDRLAADGLLGGCRDVDEATIAAFDCCSWLDGLHGYSIYASVEIVKGNLDA